MIHGGDALTVLRSLGARSVQTCVTSPPYWGLRDYGVKGQLGLEPTPAAYVARIVEVFREVRRVLADDGTLWLNLGDTYGGGKIGRTDAERNNVDGFTGSRNAAQFRPGNPGKNTGKSNRDGVGFAGLAPKNLVGIPWRVAFALQADGWILRSDIIWSKPNPMPESVRDRPTKAHEYLFLLAKSPRYFYDADAIREPHTTQLRPPGHCCRVYLDRDASHPSMQTKEIGRQYHANGRNRRTVWTISPKPFKEAHFATFPEKLVEPCILAGSRTGDTVLDPFAGAGTTGLVAARLGRAFTGIELNPEYVAMADRRVMRKAA